MVRWMEFDILSPLRRAVAPVPLMLSFLPPMALIHVLAIVATHFYDSRRSLMSAELSLHSGKGPSATSAFADRMAIASG